MAFVGRGLGIYFLLEVCSLPHELENRTVVLTRTDASGSEYCSGAHLLARLGVESGAGFPKEGVGEIREHGLPSQWCVLGRSTFRWCTCRHGFSLLLSVGLLPSTGCGHCQ